MVVVPGHSLGDGVTQVEAKERTHGLTFRWLKPFDKSYPGGKIVPEERNHDFCWRGLECSLRADFTEFRKKIRAGNINLGITGIQVAFVAWY